MKTKNRRLIPLIFTLPFLMANSPIPRVSSKEYEDYQINFVKEELVDSRYVYTYHLKNTGTGYISDLSVERETQVNGVYEYYGLHYGRYINSEDLFYETVLPVGFDQDIKMSNNKKIPNPEKMKSRVQAYNTFDSEAVISGTKAVTPKERNEYSSLDNYYYSVDLKIEHPQDDNWHYGFILNITYEEKTYYVKVDELEDYLIDSRVELDLKKLVVNNAVVIKSRPPYYGVGEVINVIIIIIVVGFFLMISFGIFAAIFFPAMARRRRARRLLIANQKNASSNNDK